VFSVEFLPLNTHLPPFNNLLARQVFNYAINRATIAELYGAPSFATPTCQPIALGLPGYRPYCPYTLHSRADGAWSALTWHAPDSSSQSRERPGIGSRSSVARTKGLSHPPPPHTSPAFCAPSATASTCAGYYYDPALDHEMRHAELLEPTDPPKSRALWEMINRQLTNDAAWVPTVTFRDIELTSGRLRNYEYNPLWGFLADQSWVQ
jgi:ABC-type transport system substrate-binding protein